jgi:anthranilate synthase/aminodeoxychorismate synthase-like glutamine amidotransferase
VIVVIDNYDSFVFNLVQALGSMGESVRVFRNDAIDVAGLRAFRPDALVLSPGPGRPEAAGVTVAAIRELSSIPTLGVCLGHQAMATAFGGRVVRADAPRHGKSSPVEHEGTDLFKDLRSPFEAGRYHSLVVERSSLPEELRVTAWTEDDTVMALRHVERPLFGVQFHPESILTPDGNRIVGNFLRLARRLRGTRPPQLCAG